MLETLLTTALVRALNVATHHLEEARRELARTKTYNIAVCSQFLEAARAAVLGLEDELDEILIEAGQVARYGWEERSGLHRRITEYLNRDRLRTPLAESLEGVGACYKFAAQDADGFFQRRTTQAQKNEALDTLLRHFSELSGFLKSLSATMEYDRVNFAGKSGIDVAELLEIEGLLDDFKDAGKDVETRKREIRTKVEAAQENRKRHGLPVVANTKRVIQELCVSFRVTTMAEPPK